MNIQISNRSKVEQSKHIHELKDVLIRKEEILKGLNERMNDLDIELKKSGQHNDNLRVKVENVEQQLKSVDKELEKNAKQMSTKETEISIYEDKLQNLSNYLDDFNELKKHIMALLHEEYDNERKSLRNSSNSSTQISMNERKSDLLKKKIEKKKEIIAKNQSLHQSRVRKLKKDQKILETVS